MSRIRPIRCFCVFVMIAQLFVVQAMAASGGLHRRFHDHADDQSHECAVTMMLAGGYASVVPDIVPVEYVPEQPPSVVIAPRAVDSVPSHLVGGVLAHSPPRGP